MVIDRYTYSLGVNNYHKKEFIKKQIVLGNSFNSIENLYNGWKNRFCGSYTSTSTFTIDRKGNVYQNYNPKYYSDFIKEKGIDKKIISITLENQGWLLKDLLKGKYIDWVGNIYRRKAKVIEKRWRGKQYWDPYTASQVKSASDLIEYLCQEYEIPNDCVGHNTFIEGVELFEGITYRSNYYKDNTDLSPAWDFKKFKKRIEKNRRYESTR